MTQTQRGDDIDIRHMLHAVETHCAAGGVSGTAWFAIARECVEVALGTNVVKDCSNHE